MFMKKRAQGFTLIELLVVIAIIGLLSTMAVVALQSARVKSRDAKRIADVKQTQTALELFVNEAGDYPTVPAGADADNDGAEIGVELNALRTPDPADQIVWNLAAGGNREVVMGQTPRDPEGGPADDGCSPAGVAPGDDHCNYVYRKQAANQYEIFFYLEEGTTTLTKGVHCGSEAGISNTFNCSH